MMMNNREQQRSPRGSVIPENPFGRTGTRVSRVGLGGEGVLRTSGRAADAASVIHTAIEQGITYYDCARVYADSELYYGSVWGQAPDVRAGRFQASKSASRDKQGALRDLDQTLDRLQTRYLDLWQIHDVRTDADFKQISGPGGALEAFREAKRQGKVRFIGVTGHHDPEILTRAVRQWPVDAVMMPVNPAEAVLGGFLTDTLPAAKERGLGVIGMKILGAGHYVAPERGIHAELLIRFALDQGVSVAIVGCSSPEEVRILARVGADETPLPRQTYEDLIRAFTPHARRLAFYRGVL